MSETLNNHLQSCMPTCIIMQPVQNSPKLLTVSCFQKNFMMLYQKVRQFKSYHIDKQTQLVKAIPALLSYCCVGGTNDIYFTVFNRFSANMFLCLQKSEIKQNLKLQHSLMKLKLSNSSHYSTCVFILKSLCSLILKIAVRLRTSFILVVLFHCTCNICDLCAVKVSVCVCVICGHRMISTESVSCLFCSTRLLLKVC